MKVTPNEGNPPKENDPENEVDSENEDDPKIQEDPNNEANLKMKMTLNREQPQKLTLNRLTSHNP